MRLRKRLRPPRRLKFTREGKYLMTIGEPGVNKGSNDPDHLGGPANFYVEPKTNELFIDTVKRIGVEPFKERVYATR